jgi:hypothetical protein
MVAATSIVGVGLAVAVFVGGCSGEGEGPTTTTTTTVAPTTTVDPLAAEEAAVSEAAEQARLSLINALVNIDDPTASAALDRWYVADSPAYQTAMQSLQDLRDEGWRVRVHPNIPESLVVEEVMLTGGPPPTGAEVLVCVVSSGILYEPGGAPDGGDAIINDAVASYRLRYLMAKVDGLWQLSSVLEIDRWEGVTTCPVENS